MNRLDIHLYPLVGDSNLLAAKTGYCTSEV